MSIPDFFISLALWGCWLVYWVVSAKGDKPQVWRESMRSRALQTLPISLGGFLILCPDLGWPGFDARFGPPQSALGLGLLVAGLLFTVWARRALGENWSADVAIRQGHELICRGPYKIVRHPIYTGGIIGSAGCALMGSQWRGLVGWALVFSTLAFKSRLEELRLFELFGERYTHYCAQVPALVPGLPRFGRAAR